MMDKEGHQVKVEEAELLDWTENRQKTLEEAFFDFAVVILGKGKVAEIVERRLRIK